MNTNEEFVRKTFTLGGFLFICWDNVKKNYEIHYEKESVTFEKNKYNLPCLILSCFLSYKKIKEYSYTGSTYANKLLYCKSGLDPELASQFIAKDNFSKVLEYVKNVFIPCMYDRKKFLTELYKMYEKAPFLSKEDEAKIDIENPENEYNAFNV